MNKLIKILIMYVIGLLIRLILLYQFFFLQLCPCVNGQLINYDDEDVDTENQNTSSEDTSNSYYDYIDNEIDMKITYRSNIERFFQALATTLRRRELQTQQNEKESREFNYNVNNQNNNNNNRFIEVIISLLPQPIKDLLNFGMKSDNSIEIEDGIKKRKEREGRIERQGFGEMLNNYRNDFQAIYPGTLWCGGGNIAKNTNDIGVFQQTDICCRQHDSCPQSIAAGKNLGFLKNNGMFTRSACNCDIQFYNCLKKVNTFISTNIGTTYFNILRPQCFGFYYPIKACVKYDNFRISDKKCIKYKLDTSKNRTLEWVDLPDF